MFVVLCSMNIKINFLQQTFVCFYLFFQRNIFNQNSEKKAKIGSYKPNTNKYYAIVQ